MGERYKKINLLFYNNSNFSFTRSPVNKFTITRLEKKQYLLYSKFFDDYIQGHGEELTLKIGKQWLYLYRWNGRIIFCVNSENLAKGEFKKILSKIKGDIKDVFL